MRSLDWGSNSWRSVAAKAARAALPAAGLFVALGGVGCAGSGQDGAPAPFQAAASGGVREGSVHCTAAAAAQFGISGGKACFQVVDGQAQIEDMVLGDAADMMDTPSLGQQKLAYQGALWRGGTVPYAIGGTFTADQTGQIEEAIAVLNSYAGYTGATLRPKRKTDSVWLKFQANTTMAFNGQATVGYVASPYLKLNFPRMAANGIEPRGVILHEIGHVLGFAHEHQRPDRDQYVDIVWKDIKSAYLASGAFTALSGSEWRMLGEYDFASVMHYPWDNASVQPGVLPTLLKKDGSRFITGFTTGELSQNDLDSLRALYRSAVVY